MTCIIDLDPATADTLHQALGGETLLVPTFEALRRHLDAHLTEDAVVVGPTVDLHTALTLAEQSRLGRPGLAIILVRRRVDTSVLTDALRSGMFEVIEERDLAGLTASVRRARDLSRRLRETRGTGTSDDDSYRRGTVVTVFSAKGGCGKTTLATNLAGGLPRRSRPRLR
jgi:pilus assembly protein CpaE